MTTASSAASDDGLWLRCFHPAPEAKVRLVCFPHAGGAASFFFPMAEMLLPNVEMLAVQYPGRQDRRSEKCLDSVQGLAVAIAGQLRRRTDLPLALFGHSLGATVAFEVARLLESAENAEALAASGQSHCSPLGVRPRPYTAALTFTNWTTPGSSRNSSA